MRRRSRLFLSKQSLRSPQQQQDGERIDENGAALGQIEFQYEIEHAQDQRGVIDAHHAAEPADRHRDQEIHQIFERVLRIEPQKFGAQPAADSGHAAAERKGDGEQPVDIDAERFRHAAVVDGGANLGANAGALEGERDAEPDQKSDHDQENAVGAILQEAEIDLAAQSGRQLQGLAFRTDYEDGAGDEKKNQPEGEQHLVELAGPVEPPIERSLQHHADGGGGDKAERERGGEAEMRAVHRQHDHVAAEHGKGAVGEVDEAHQPHGDGQPDRDDEQHGAGGQSAQQNTGEVSDDIHAFPKT